MPGVFSVMSLQELGRCIHAGEITLEDALREMKEEACSVSLSWSSSDHGYWKCLWNVEGVVYVGVNPNPRWAILAAVVKCFADISAKVPHDPYGAESKVNPEPK